MINDEILVAIFNYDCNVTANKLLKQFSQDFETVVLDSGSPNPDEKFLQLDNVYYNGMLNHGIKLMKERNLKRFLLITSDIEIDDENYHKIKTQLNNLESDIGVYSVSATKESRAHKQCYNQNTNGYRNVKFVEGFFVCVNEEILDKIYPINVKVNKLGWCSDIQFAYHATKLNLRIVVDDAAILFHPNGTGYNNAEARREMISYVEYLNDDGFTEYIINCKVGIKKDKLWQTNQTGQELF